MTIRPSCCCIRLRAAAENRSAIGRSRNSASACAPTRVVVVGKSKLRIKIPENCVDLSNQTTLLQLIWLIRAARFVVSVDSGPVHIAAAISDRLIAIHTWTDPRRVGPYNANAWVWRSGELRQMRDFPVGKKLPRGRRFRKTDVATVTQLMSDLWEAGG